VLIGVGFNVTFFPQFIMGAQGMPRRYYNYIDQFQPFHVTSTIGSYIMGAGFLVMAGYLLYSLLKGRQAPSNPWGSRALEWQTSSPAPAHNFNHTPVVLNGPYDYHKPMKEFQMGIADKPHAHH
jgi:cytochrome c oxidase subunit 1